MCLMCETQPKALPPLFPSLPSPPTHKYAYNLLLHTHCVCMIYRNIRFGMLRPVGLLDTDKRQRR